MKVREAGNGLAISTRRDDQMRFVFASLIQMEDRSPKRGLRLPVPDYQSLMLPLLQALSDGIEHDMTETTESLAREFRLTTDDRRQLLPSGRQPTFENRVGWARTYMKKAGLLESTARGKIRITQRGLDVLKTNPPRIDVRLLAQFPEFVQFRAAGRDEGEGKETGKKEEPATLEETLETSHAALTSILAADLLDRLKKCSPEFFEHVVVDLLVQMGYGGSLKSAGKAIGQSRDGGVDGVINEDKLGLDVVYIQAKRWEEAVGRPVVQAFAGSLEGLKARKGVLMTTSRFTDDAQEYVKRIEKRIVLIDGATLARFLIEHNIGVTEVATYPVKKVDLDYFEGE